MEWEIIKDFDNRLMERRELIIRIDYGGGPTPSKAELQAIVAKKFAVEPSRVEIDKIMSEKGYSAGKVWVKIWDKPKVDVLFKEEKDEASEKSEEKAKGEENAEKTTE